MAWNLNNKPREYELSGRLTAEFIDIYGLSVDYIVTEKVSQDLVLGEFTHMRADNDSVFRVSVYPENTAGFDNQNDLLSKFGILNFDSVNLFISSAKMALVHPDGNYQKAHGDIIVLPSGKFFEITDVENQVMGLNNMFTYSNQKNVYLLKCKPYNYNRDELNVSNLSSDLDLGNLDSIFDMEQQVLEKEATEEQSTKVDGLDPVFGDMG